MKPFLLYEQRGAATLLTAVVLLISITLVALLVSKTVLIETQITADNYRNSQASAAANAAMDEAVSYFFHPGGLDHNNDEKPDYIVGAEPSESNCIQPTSTEGKISNSSGSQTTLAQYYFDNRDDNLCDDAPLATRCPDKDADGDGDCFGVNTGPGGYGTDMTKAAIIAKGWSDDCSAVRVITQCVNQVDVFVGGGGPKQPFVSRAGVGAFGNARIINRYNNSTIWSGGNFGTPDTAFGTYLRPSNTEIADYTDGKLNSPDESLNTQVVSNNRSGVGVDIITSDATLSSKSETEFFEMFFGRSKSEMIDLSDKQYTPTDDLSDLSGLIWVNGNKTIGGTDVIGTLPVYDASGNTITDGKPAILIVDGDLTINGGTIYGVVYATGVLKLGGNSEIYGSVVGQNGMSSGAAGTPTIVYVPFGGVGAESDPPTTNTGAIVPGSWKDW